MRSFLMGCLLAILFPGVTRAQQGVRNPLTLDNVMESLDRTSHTFRSLEADVERTKVTVVVDDRSTESGKIWVRGDSMRLELTSPDARTILRRGDHLYIYTPGLKRVEEYNLGKSRGLVDQFLLLGFGASGHDLRKPYLVTLLGEPFIENHRTAWIELTPKSEEVRNQFSKIQLWLDESSWLPLEQKFFETGSQDYFVIRYRDLVRNPPIEESRFKPEWPKGTVKFTPPVG